MYIRKPNTLVELLARGRYLILHYLQKADPITHVEYRHHRWYKRDNLGRVIKVTKTYFEVMQPY